MQHTTECFYRDWPAKLMRWHAGSPYLQAADREGVTVLQLDVSVCLASCCNGAAHTRPQRLRQQTHTPMTAKAWAVIQDGDTLLLWGLFLVAVTHTACRVQASRHVCTVQSTDGAPAPM